jgi:hypothetical protein
METFGSEAVRSYSVSLFDMGEWTVIASNLQSPAAMLVVEGLLVRGYDRDQSIEVDANPVDMSAAHLDVLLPEEWPASRREVEKVVQGELFT